MVAPGAIDQIHERRDERAFPARSRSRDEHKPLGLDRQRLNLAPQAEMIGRDRTHRHQPEHAAGAAMIAEAHAADATDVLDVADPLGRRACAQRLVAAIGHERQQQRNHIVRCVHRFAVQALKLAIHPDGRPRVGGQIERRCTARGGRSEQALETRQRIVGRDRRVASTRIGLRDIGSTTAGGGASRGVGGRTGADLGGAGADGAGDTGGIGLTGSNVTSGATGGATGLTGTDGVIGGATGLSGATAVVGAGGGGARRRRRHNHGWHGCGRRRRHYRGRRRGRRRRRYRGWRCRRRRGQRRRHHRGSGWRRGGWRWRSYRGRRCGRGRCHRSPDAAGGGVTAAGGGGGAIGVGGIGGATGAVRSSGTRAIAGSS